jgi:hypothetical protein
MPSVGLPLGVFADVALFGALGARGYRCGCPALGVRYSSATQLCLSVCMHTAAVLKYTLASKVVCMVASGYKPAGGRPG